MNLKVLTALPFLACGIAGHPDAGTDAARDASCDPTPCDVIGTWRVVPTCGSVSYDVRVVESDGGLNATFEPAAPCPPDSTVKVTTTESGHCLFEYTRDAFCPGRYESEFETFHFKLQTCADGSAHGSFGHYSRKYGLFVIDAGCPVAASRL